MKPDDVVNVMEDHVDETEIVSDRRIQAATDTEKYRDALQALWDHGIQYLITITGTDMGEEIELIYHLDCGEGVILDLSMGVPKDNLEVPTITDIYPSSVLYELELRDLLGVEIKNHPNPRKLIMADNWPEDKHPLRLEEMEEKGGEE